MTPQEHEELAAAVAEFGAFPMPAGSDPKPVERDELRAAFIKALSEAARTHPCPISGPYWTGCVHYDDAGRVSGVGSCHSERRADAVLAVRDAEMERLRARVAELEAGRKADHETWQHDLRTARSEREAAAARVAELESERHSTNEALDDAVQALRADALTEPAEVDAHLRAILAEDAYLKFQQAIGEHALAEAVEDAGTVRASADNDGLYNADWREGWDDAIERVDPDRNGACPSTLVEFSAEPDGITRRIVPTQALREDEDRIVAYRDPTNHDTLLCREHGAPVAWVNPVASEDLPDGGFCTYGRMTGAECGRDVLIPQAVGAEEPTGAVEWCTGCNTDHDPGECGYRPESGGA